MKKILTLVTIALFILFGACARKPYSTMINKYKNVDGVVAIEAKGLLVKLAKLMSPELKNSKIKSLKVLVLTNCSDSDKAMFNNDIKQIIKEDDVLMLVKDNEDIILISSNNKKNFITLLVGGEEPVILEIKGKLSMENIQYIIENYR